MLADFDYCICGAGLALAELYLDKYYIHRIRRASEKQSVSDSCAAQLRPTFFDYIKIDK